MDDDRSADGCAGAMDKATPEDRSAAIARDYLEERMPIGEILKRHRISYRNFYRLIDDNGWARRGPQDPKKRRLRVHSPAALLARLRKLARRRIAVLEKVAGEGDAGLAGQERFAKALTALLALLTRIEQLQAASRADTADADTVMTPEEADERRQKLAQMLVAMLEQASGQRLPEGG